MDLQTESTYKTSFSQVVKEFIVHIRVECLRIVSHDSYELCL